MWSSTFHSSQIHLVCELRLWSALHPERGPAALGPGPGTLSTDHRGSAPQHLAPLQDPARVPAPPSAAELPEHNHHLPQEHQGRLQHRAELPQPADGQALLLQRGAGGHRQASLPRGSFSVAPQGLLPWSAVFTFRLVEPTTIPRPVCRKAPRCDFYRSRRENNMRKVCCMFTIAANRWILHCMNVHHCTACRPVCFGFFLLLNDFRIECFKQMSQWPFSYCIKFVDYDYFKCK